MGLSLNRRAFIGASAAATAFPTLAVAEDWILTPQEAHERARSGETLLIDIRRPSEWAEAAPAGAALNSMHQAGFLERLAQATGGDAARPIALICATGGRSAFLASRLRAYGYTQVYDVSEGMYGSRAGPGWIQSGLPLIERATSPQ